MISLISISILIVILVDLCNGNVGNELKAVGAPHLELSQDEDAVDDKEYWFFCFFISNQIPCELI